MASLSESSSSPLGPPTGSFTPQGRSSTVERIEVELLVTAIRERYGYDFEGYSRASLTRRLWKLVQAEGLSTLSGLIERLLHDPSCIGRVIDTISVSLTSMFRDPSFYSALRDEVLPYLSTYPHIRIWVAGCCSGEEVYSLAILLEEEGLLSRSRIYATDMSRTMLDVAREGIFPLASIRQYTHNYIESGGRGEFSSYYTAKYERARLAPRLRKDVVFSEHNLVTDSSFNEFHLVLCRNVMIYFRPELQSKVHGLLHSSLRQFGVLCLGDREVLRGSPHEGAFVQMSPGEQIYRKVQ